MRAIVIDFETKGFVDIKRVVTQKYAQSAEVLITASYDAEPEVCEGLDPRLREWAVDPDVVLVAHNVPFERSVMAYAGIPTPTSKWVDTMALSQRLGGPGGLDEAVRWWKSGEMKGDGGRLIQMFSVKHAEPSEHPEEWAKFMAYALQDVVAERALWEKLGSCLEMPLDWHIDQEINDRGVRIDVAFVRALAAQADEYFSGLRAEFVAKYGFPPKSPVKCKDWVNERTGLGLTSMNAKELEDVDWPRQPEEVQEFIYDRSELVTAAWAKYKAMDESQIDGRVHGVFRYCGAARTGRWSSRVVQLHNLPRAGANDDQIEQWRADVLAGRPLPTKAYKQCLRSVIIPNAGHNLITADFSQIEARVTAWYAGQQDMLASLVAGRLYEDTAEKLFRLPPGSVTKDSPERLVGKAASLALGFGGGAGALVRAGGIKDMSESELETIKQTWRTNNANIVRMWYDMWRYFTANYETKMFGLTFEPWGSGRRVTLPSGRAIHYPGLHWEEGRKAFFHTPFGRKHLWHGVLVENIVQATARDILASLLETVAPYCIGHIHDEVILEVPKEQCSAMIKLLKQWEPPSWAEGLPVAMDIQERERYGK